MLLTEDQARKLSHVARSRNYVEVEVRRLEAARIGLAREVARAVDAGIPLRRVAAVAGVSHVHVRQLAAVGRESIASDPPKIQRPKAVELRRAVRAAERPGLRGTKRGRKRK